MTDKLPSVTDAAGDLAYAYFSLPPHDMSSGVSAQDELEEVAEDRIRADRQAVVDEVERQMQECLEDATEELETVLRRLRRLREEVSK